LAKGDAAVFMTGYAGRTFKIAVGGTLNRPWCGLDTPAVRQKDETYCKFLRIEDCWLLGCDADSF
jgi:hypothetical protein